MPHAVWKINSNSQSYLRPKIPIKDPFFLRGYFSPSTIQNIQVGMNNSPKISTKDTKMKKIFILTLFLLLN